MAKGTSKRPLIQEKPNGEFGIPPPPSASSRKKQKLSKIHDVQSGDKLNDVTTVSGINLMEEQEQLLSGLTERSWSSLSSLTVAHEEKEKATILQRTPLVIKLEQIMSTCGIRSMSTDIEHCLSMGVEEMMHRLIRNMIRVSKARLDIEKAEHNIHNTSDIQHQIVLMSQKVQYREKQQEHEGVDVERITNKTMQADATNAAARAAVEGKDLASKWRFMAEKENKKHGISEHPTKKLIHGSSRMSASRNSDHLESIEGTENSRGGDIFAKPQKGANLISIKDVMAVLEKESQKLKLTQIYSLHERFMANERSKVNLY